MHRFIPAFISSCPSSAWHYQCITALVFAFFIFASPGMASEEAAQASASMELGAPFRDHAILQRQMELPVWGWSQPGSSVSVAFAGQKKTAVAGSDGKWMLTLDPMEASFEPREMVITGSGGKSSTLKNILVGEVWMASGQSNMQWKAGASDCMKLKTAPYGDKKINPIREFEVSNVVAQLHPIEKADGAWKDGDYNDYSAIALAFAHKLYHEIKVPIGILNCSFSQTPIQAWVPREGFAGGTDERTKEYHLRCLQTDPTTPEHKEAWEAFYKSADAALEAGEAIPHDLPGNLRGNRDASWLFNGKLNPVVPYAIRGAIWNQGYANKEEGLVYYHNLHSLVRGWRSVWQRPELPVYFHQFYTPKEAGRPTLEATAEMRLGTWMARDIPHTGMASQIDIGGAVHYRSKTLPGQRLALHALKNQYGQPDLPADGPMFRSYTVEGNKIIVHFDHAESGLVVAQTEKTGTSPSLVAPDGESQVRFFYIAGEDRIWHQATMKIVGSSVELSAPGLKHPRGVCYGTGGIGFEPNLYNKALLPTTPFIYYDQKMVLSKDWPGGELLLTGDTVNPIAGTLQEEYLKCPLLAPQFFDYAVLQANQPVTVWGSTQKQGQFGGELEKDAVIELEFGDFKKTVSVAAGSSEWQVVLPPMPATSAARDLKVRFLIDGELAQERISTGIVIGEVWYVVGPPLPAPQKKSKAERAEASKQIPPVAQQLVRMMTNESKRSYKDYMSRFSPSVSASPDTRFLPFWRQAEDFAQSFGAAIQEKTGHPVGIIYMGYSSSKGRPVVLPLKAWIHYDYLKEAPSLMEDYAEVAAVYPGTPYYQSSGKAHLAAWKSYWDSYIPEMMASKAVPDGEAWGTYPALGGKLNTTASQCYNVLTHSFTPAALRGVVFLSYPMVVEQDQGAFFGEQMSALGNSYKGQFQSDPVFVYTIPDKALAPKITQPASIRGASHAVGISDWKDTSRVTKNVIEGVYSN